MQVLISLIITYFGYITHKMASILPVTQEQFKHRASIMAAIVVGFNFVNGALNYSGDDLSKFEFDSPEPVYADDIQSALNTKSIRDVLTIQYSQYTIKLNLDKNDC
jgi:cytochrome c biogenesis protein CcdA